MGVLSQLVILASIVASCISDSILSPEQLQMLLRPIVLTESLLENRYGDIEETPCRSHDDVGNYYIVEATDQKYYYVVTNETQILQQVVHKVCDNGPNDNKCNTTTSVETYGYCCRQHKRTVPMHVVPVPKDLLELRDGRLFHKGTNEKYEDYTMVQKDVMMNSDCSCDQSSTSVEDNFTCPDPDSEKWP